MKQWLVAIAFVAVLAGCNSRISNYVGSDDYELYAAWMKAHLSNTPQRSLYVSSHTFVFDPLDATGPCQGHNKSAVPRALLQQLHALGQAEYRLDVYSPSSKLHIPWGYTAVEDWRLIPPESSPFQAIEFSRIAFDRAHDNAFFAVDDVCGGLSGKGGTIYAHRRNGAWSFEDGGCTWIE